MAVSDHFLLAHLLDGWPWGRQIKCSSSSNRWNVNTHFPPTSPTASPHRWPTGRQYFRRMDADCMVHLGLQLLADSQELPLTNSVQGRFIGIEFSVLFLFRLNSPSEIIFSASPKLLATTLLLLFWSPCVCVCTHIHCNAAMWSSEFHWSGAAWRGWFNPFLLLTEIQLCPTKDTVSPGAEAKQIWVWLLPGWESAWEYYVCCLAFYIRTEAGFQCNK